MRIPKRHLPAIVVIGLTSLIILNGCSTGNRTASPAKVKHAVINTSAPHTFDEEKNWINPDSSPYAPGLSSVITPKIPSAFEESVIPRNGVASIYVSRRNGTVGESDPFKKDWTEEIHYTGYFFEINGQTYSVPAEYRKQQILLLPIDNGIVWAPVRRQGDMSNIQQALQGTTDIYYTPYNPHGGSLANSERLIAQLPHRWMGLDGGVIASAWTGWLPKGKVALPYVKSETVYHLEFTKNDQVKSVIPVKGNVPGWTTLFMRKIDKPAYYPKPHYAVDVRSLTRTYGGFTLELSFIDETQSGRNEGITSATYYWSEKTGKWTPLAQNYTVQTLAAWTDTGSDGVYWIQPCSYTNGYNVAEMYFDPSTLSIESIWLGDSFFGESLVNGNSWAVVINGKWTVYTP